MQEPEPQPPSNGLLVERFWSERGTSLVLDRSGLLSEPRPHEFGWSLNPDVVADAELAQHRCLVLLGEPGSGKSTAVGESHAAAISPGGFLPSEFNGAVLRVSLEDYGDESRLVSEILDGHEVRAWLSGEHELALILDSFDECQLRVENLARVLQGKVRTWPCKRLLLRVACRTASWPSALEPELERAFGAAPFVVEIAPLRAVDVVEVARSRGLDGPGVLAAIETAGAGPLAARPLTLGMLLDGYTAEGFPAGLLQLYREAVPRMLAEHDLLREAVSTPPVPPETALAVAHRIAAALLLTGTTAVCGRTTAASVSELTIHDLAVGTEPLADRRLAIGSEDVRAVIGSALFTSRGPDRFGFAHFSFAEMLCAEWLCANELGEQQLRQLLVTSDGAVVPSLRNVAGWLIAGNPSKYGWLAEADPDVVTSSAVDIDSDEIRARAVRQILDDAKLRAWGRASLQGLGYSGLADDLRPELQSAELERRLVAIDIAGSCGVGALEPDLVAIATNESDAPHVRLRAAIGVRALTGDGETNALAGIVRNPPLEDPNGNILAVALEASWPHAVTLPEVLEAMTFPGRPNHIGHFRMFANHTLAPALKSDDVKDVLPWLLERESRNESLDRLEGLADRIVELASDGVGSDPKLDRDLARLVWRRIARHEELQLRSRRGSATDLFEDDDRRRALLGAVLEVSESKDKDHVWYLSEHMNGLGLCRRADFVWLTQHVETLAPAAAELAVTVATHLFDPSLAESRDRLLTLPSDHPVRLQLAHYIEPMALDSKQALAWRRRRDSPRIERKVPTDGDIENEVNRCLGLFEDGDHAAFPHADFIMATELGSDRSSFDPPPSMSERPRWTTVDPETRDRLCRCAKRYLLEASSGRDAWQGRTLDYSSVAGVNSFALLLAERRSEFDSLPDAVWAAWAGSLFDRLNRPGDLPVPAEIFAKSVQAARTGLQAAALAEIAATADEYLYLSGDLLDAIWDDNFEMTILAVCEARTGDGRQQLLAILAPRALDNSRDMLLSIVTETSEDYSDRLQAARLLLDCGEAGDWRAVVSLVKSDPSFGDQLFLSLSTRSRRGAEIPLPSRELADLYEWVLGRFPPESDPEIDGVHAVGNREEVGFWRDGLLGVLGSRADHDAVGALGGLMSRHPDRLSIRFQHRAAVEQCRLHEHVPLRLSELLRLAERTDQQLVRTPRELRMLLVQVLSEIQENDLQGNIPEAHLLWDEKAMHPKNEDPIADYLANRIKEKLSPRIATVLREVHTRRPRSSGLPERADIWVECHLESGETLTVVIECKGAWHRDVPTAARTQLVGQYLADVPSAEGVFLVIWFDLAEWGKGDRRRAQVRATTRSQMTELVDREVDELVSEGHPVSAVVIDASYRQPAAS